MYGKNRRGLQTNNMTPTNIPLSRELDFVASSAMNAANYLLSFCVAPSSSDDECSPRNPRTSNLFPSEPAASATRSSTCTKQDAPLKLTKAAQAFTKEEETARQSVTTVCDDELLRTEALFCAAAEKQALFQQEIAGRNILFSKQLFLMHLPAAAAIQTEEKQARADLEAMFKDDKVIVESGAAQSQLFKPAAPKKSLSEWIPIPRFLSRQ